MPLLLETIKIEEGKVCNLDYHQQRFDKSREALFNDNTPIALHTYIDAPKKGLFRCRISYEREIHSVEYIPYVAKEIHSLKVVQSDINYAYKYANRDIFSTLLHSYAEYDEIILEKKGFVTDTTISNVAFYDGAQWFTPAKPLLEGTMRAKLLDEGFLHEKSIRASEIPLYKKVALINAMLGFKIINAVITL